MVWEVMDTTHGGEFLGIGVPVPGITCSAINKCSSGGMEVSPAAESTASSFEIVGT